MTSRVAVAARRWAVSTGLAARSVPVLAPPLRAAGFLPPLFEGRKLIYICLHGLPEQPYWYGSDWSTAISAPQIQSCNLGGAIVYLAGCYGQGPMTNALLEAGASAVVGSGDSVWGGYYLPSGTNGMGMRVVRALEQGMNVSEALASAKERARQMGPRDIRLAAAMAIAGDLNAVL